MTDPRRKLIAEAKGGAVPLTHARTLFPGVVALIEELTAKLRRSRVMVEAQTADIERCERAIVREEVRATQAEATIATQAAEIERLREDGFRCANCDTLAVEDEMDGYCEYCRVE